MKSSDALLVLADVSASQWGMVTTAQAAEKGVGRLTLSRLAKTGHLERLVHGVYADSGAPTDEFQSLRAAWLATDPALTADQRLDDLARCIVVMGESAASLHGVGDLPADQHHFSTPIRRQTLRPDVRYRRRLLDPDDITIMHGLPVTTLERTLADLVEARTDLTLIADALRDAVRAGRLDVHRLEELLRPLAARNRFRPGDGAALLDHLIELAGIDMAGLSREIGASEALSMHVAANALADLDSLEMAETTAAPAIQQALRKTSEAFAQIIEPSLTRAVKEVSASFANSPAMAELQANVARISRKIADDLPTQEVLGTFGRELANSLDTAALSRIDMGRVLEAIDAAETSALKEADE